MGKLEGARLVVTRPTAADDGLAPRLAAAGAEVLHFPAQVIEPLCDPAPSGDFDIAIFTSPAAVAHGFERIADLLPPRLAAVGRGTARRLEAAGAEHVLLPRAGAGLLALLREPELQELAGQRVLLVGGKPLNRRSVLTLTRGGAKVMPWLVYERRPVRRAEPLVEWIRSGEANAIIVSSVAAVVALAALPGVDLGAVAWICSSPRVAGAVERGGGRPSAVADSADDAELAAAATRWWQSERGDERH
ncbi:MAG: uroporphyrinogen-III synthase [Gammaproteobacteria bacterium]